jgi:uncharacterized protein YlxP (DUF503 family)
MHIAALTLELHLPGCHSLKEKRSRIKPLLAAIHRKFNVSASEIDQNDRWQLASIACVAVSNDSRHVQKLLNNILAWIEIHFPDLQVIDDKITVL